MEMHMKVSLGLVGAIVLFFVAVWAGSKYPNLNLISRVMGS